MKAEKTMVTRQKPMKRLDRLTMEIGRKVREFPTEDGLRAMTRGELRSIAMEQLARDLNCSASDFLRKENTIVKPRILKGRRQYIPGTFYLQMATFGQGAVICAAPAIHGWLREFAFEKRGCELFEEHNLFVLDHALARYGKRLFHTAHLYLPEMDKLAVRPLADVVWYEGTDISQFYEDKRFYNALQYRDNPERPDVLAVAAYRDGGLAALAGASADTPLLWQIGVDVIPQYQGQGLGTYVVSLLKEEILNRGRIPFYGTSSANISSQNVARRCGFFPAWTECYTMETT